MYFCKNYLRNVCNRRFGRQWSIAGSVLGRDVTIPIRYWGIGIGIGVGISITLKKRYLDKLLIFHKVWSKVFGVVESESINGFSKFWKEFLCSKKT